MFSAKMSIILSLLLVVMSLHSLVNPSLAQQTKQETTTSDLDSLLKLLEAGDFTKDGAVLLKLRLTLIGAPAVKPLTEVVRSSRSPWAPIIALEVLGEIGDRRAVPPLLDILQLPDNQAEPKHPIPPTRDSKEEQPFLLDRGGYTSLRSLIADTLGEIGDKRAVPTLIEVMLKDKDPLVRGRAIVALGEIGDARAFTPLCDVATSCSCDSEMRQAIVGALRKTGDIGKAVTRLADVLTGKSTLRVKINTIKVLGEIGRNRNMRPLATVPLVTVMERSTDGQVVSATLGVLRSMYTGLPFYEKEHWLLWFCYDQGVNFAAEGRFAKARSELAKCLVRKVDPNKTVPETKDAIEKFLENRRQTQVKRVLNHLYSAAQFGLNVLADIRRGELQKEAVIHYFRGIRYGNTGMKQKAVLELRKAIELEPNYAVFRNSLGNEYADAGKLDKAVQEYKKAISIDRAYGLAYWNLAVTYYDMRRYTLAIQYCDMARKLGFEGSPEFLKALEPHRK